MRRFLVVVAITAGLAAGCGGGDPTIDAGDRPTTTVQARS